MSNVTVNGCRVEKKEGGSKWSTGPRGTRGSDPMNTGDGKCFQYLAVMQGWAGR